MSRRNAIASMPDYSHLMDVGQSVPNIPSQTAPPPFMGQNAPKPTKKAQKGGAAPQDVPAPAPVAKRIYSFGEVDPNALQHMQEGAAKKQCADAEKERERILKAIEKAFKIPK